MLSIGLAKFTNFDGLIQYINNLTVETTKQLRDCVLSTLDKSPRQDSDYSIIKRVFEQHYFDDWHYRNNTDEGKERWLKEKRKFLTKLFGEYKTFIDIYAQPLNVGKWIDGNYAYVFFGNPYSGMIIPAPEKYMEFIPSEDFSEITPAGLKTLLGLHPNNATQDVSLLPVAIQNTVTHSSVAADIGGAESRLNILKEEMESVKNAKTEELAVLQAEIEEKQKELNARKRELMSELEQKKAEMETALEKLENQIYLLDSEIYSIRCYAGEIVKFGQIRKGSNAPDDEPVVLHQKLRFLDEDLGRLASLYEIAWDDVHLFEEFLKHSPLALDTFAPNDRCVMLVRLSRTAKKVGEYHGFRGDLPYHNIMSNFDYYHGATIGIIIRNGENVFLGWTDEERVHIKDNFINTESIDFTPEAMPEFTFDSERERYIKNKKAERKQSIDGIISRVFIYSILQGIVDNTPVMPLPKGTRLEKQSEYVIYAVADKWLADKRFGSFNDIIAKCNETMKVGDIILTAQRVVPEHNRENYKWSGGRYDNARGRGDKNRTHDCSVDDCALYPVNLIEFGLPEQRMRYRYSHDNPESGERYYSEHVTSAGAKLSEECEILEEFTYRRQYVYVSVQKEYSPSGSARSNFEINSDEYINLTYMNSVWLEWVITNKELGGWKSGGLAVNYAYAIRYLKTAMDFVREREREEKYLIDAENKDVCKNPEWTLALSEWKMAKGVSKITQYQARRFVRHMQQCKKAK
jgi:Chromosome segregation ATPases